MNLIVNNPLIRHSKEVKNFGSLTFYRMSSLPVLTRNTGIHKCRTNDLIYYHHYTRISPSKKLRGLFWISESKYHVNKILNTAPIMYTKHSLLKPFTTFASYSTNFQSLVQLCCGVKDRFLHTLHEYNIFSFLTRSRFLGNITSLKETDTKLLSLSNRKLLNVQFKSNKSKPTSNILSTFGPCPSTLVNLAAYDTNQEKISYQIETRSYSYFYLFDQIDNNNFESNNVYKNKYDIINRHSNLASFSHPLRYPFQRVNYSSSSSTKSNRKQNYYEILGVSPSATAREIKVAYFQLAKKVHPDLNPNDPKAKQKFVSLSAAYEVLSDSKKRQEYDYNGYKTAEDIQEEMYQQQKQQSYKSGQSYKQQNSQYSGTGGFYNRNPFNSTHHYNYGEDMRDYEELFRQVQSERYIVEEAMNEVMRDIQEDLVYAVNSGMRGEWKEVWEVAKDNKGIIFTFVVLPTIIFRFPPLTKLFISSLGFLSRISFFAMSSGMIYPSTLGRYAWRLIVSSAKNKRQRDIRKSSNKANTDGGQKRNPSKKSSTNTRENWKWWGK